MTALPAFERGLHDLGVGCHVWYEPPGGWGYSNSGVVLGEGEALVVDTQNDMKLGRDLRSAVDAVASERRVSFVVNTHSDGDHWNGNLLYPDARIIASEATVEEMRNMWLEPDRMADLADRETAFGRFIAWRIATFDFEQWQPVLPTESYSGRQVLDVGGREVELIEVGPAHTQGDTIVHVPSAGVVYAGDVLFTGSTPIVWAGPISGCLAALDTIIACDPRVIIAGHGRAVTPAELGVVRDYFELVSDHAATCFRAGKSVDAAYDSLDLGTFADWPHASRAYQNLVTAYRDLDPRIPVTPPPEALEMVLLGDDGDWVNAGYAHGTSGHGGRE